MERFIDNGDGTVTDTNTGLMWQQEDDGIVRCLDGAEYYVSALKFGGYYDWRVPTIHELFSLIDFTIEGQLFDKSFFKNIVADHYLSSTCSIKNQYVFCVNFFDGTVIKNSIDGRYNLLLVRRIYEK